MLGDQKGAYETLMELVSGPAPAAAPPPTATHTLEAILASAPAKREDLDAIDERRQADGIGPATVRKPTPLGTELAAAIKKRAETEHGPVPPVRDADAALAVSRGTLTSALRGVMYPVSAFFPSTYEKLEKSGEEDRKTFEQYLQQPTLGQKLNPTAAGIASRAPDLMGNLVGTLVPGGAIVKGSNAIWRVGEGLDVVRNVTAGITAGAAFSTFAKADSGEDRAMNVLRDMSLGGAGEAIIFPLLHSVTRAELGTRTQQMVDSIAKSLNTSTDNAESVLAGVRGGVSSSTKSARAVVAAGIQAGAEQTPPVAQAKKVIQAMEDILPKQWVIDPSLGANYGARFDLVIGTERTPVRFQSNPDNPKGFQQQVVAIRQLIESAQAQGTPVSIENAYSAHPGVVSRINGLMLPQKKTRTVGTPMPDAAPAGSASHTGVVPTAGTNVEVQTPAGRIQAQVIAGPAAETATATTQAEGAAAFRAGQEEGRARHAARQAEADATLAAARQKWTDTSGTPGSTSTAPAASDVEPVTTKIDLRPATPGVEAAPAIETAAAPQVTPGHVMQAARDADMVLTRDQTQQLSTMLQQGSSPREAVASLGIVNARKAARLRLRLEARVEAASREAPVAAPAQRVVPASTPGVEIPGARRLDPAPTAAEDAATEAAATATKVARAAREEQPQGELSPWTQRFINELERQKRKLNPKKDAGRIARLTERQKQLEKYGSRTNAPYVAPVRKKAATAAPTKPKPPKEPYVPTEADTQGHWLNTVPGEAADGVNHAADVEAILARAERASPGARRMAESIRHGASPREAWEEAGKPHSLKLLARDLTVAAGEEHNVRSTTGALSRESRTPGILPGGPATPGALSAEEKAAEAAAARAKKGKTTPVYETEERITRPDMVWIRNLQTGEEQEVPLTSIYGQVPQATGTHRIVAHDDGTAKRFTVDLAANGLVDVEGHNTNRDRSFWRSSVFTTDDPENEFGHQIVKGFVASDGTITLSTTPVSTFKMELRYGPTESYGPIDRVAGARGKKKLLGRSPGGAAAGDFIQEEAQVAERGSVSHLERSNTLLVPESKSTGEIIPGKMIYDAPRYEEGSYPAGFEPSSQHLWRRDPEGRLEIDLATRERSRPFDEKLTDQELSDTERKQVRKIQRVGEGLDQDRSNINFSIIDPHDRVSQFKSWILGRDQGEAMEAVTLRNAARRLIKEGQPESTPVVPRIVFDRHVQSKLPPTMTLGDLAHINLKSISVKDLTEEAAWKGYKVSIEGDGVYVESLLSGEKQRFDHPLEAMEALGRIPSSQEGPKIEGQLERVWGLGRERGWDADVDIKRFAPAQLADTALQELVEAKRPAISFWVKSDPKDLGVVNVQNVIDSMARTNPVLRTVKTQIIETSEGRTHVLLYQPSAVEALMQKYAKGFATIGADPINRKIPGRPAFKPVSEFLSELSTIPDGVDILKGRDPSDGFMYSWLKSKGMKEEFLNGKLQNDAQGQFRTFTPEEKRGFGKLSPC